MLTVDLVARTLPTNLKKTATQSLVDQLNNISSDPEIAEAMRENFLSYTNVMQEGRFKIEDYLNAVKFVTFKLMNHTNKDAYIRTFPKRYQDLMANGVSEKDVSSYVSMYASGKLVNLILEKTLVPTWILNAEYYQKAINAQVRLMTTAKSEMVQTAAANSLLTHLKRPEAVGPGININMPETSGVNELRDMLAKLAVQQKQLIERGVPTREIASQVLIEGEVVSVEKAQS
jgi:hypothetical protein